MHYRFDQEQGAKLGDRVGTFLYKHQLRPKHGHGLEAADEEPDADETGQETESPRGF